MAIGTLGSRVTGFLRTVVLAAALGVHELGNAYNIGNTLPNIVYDLLLGGVLAAVVVPSLVEAAQQDGDGGESFAQSLLTITVISLALVSVVSVLAAPLIVRVYLAHAAAASRPMAVTFARYFLPQLFFYGVGAVIGAILNVRGRFAAPMWTPILNNLVVIGVGLLFYGVSSGAAVRAGRLDATDIRILGIGTTAGVVVQTLALVPAVRRTGLRLRPRFGHRDRLVEAIRLSAWMLVYVATNQVLLLVVINLSDAVKGTGTGYTSYLYAYTLFQLPYAAIAVSVITALMPRLAAHAVDHRTEAIRADLSYGLRMTGALIVPLAAAVFVLGPSITTLVLGFGRTSLADARFIGYVLSAFAVGMVPFSAYQVEVRAFYALRDTRTPAIINLKATAFNVVVDLIAFAVLPPRWLVTGLAGGFSLSYAVALWLSTAKLMRTLRGSQGNGVVRTHVRLTVATAVGSVVLLAMLLSFDGLLGDGRAAALLALVVGGSFGGFAFLRAAALIDIPEVRSLGGLLVSRLRPAP